ncbi:MAG: ATP-binding protein [Thaumarchaeota archaeon]|nr:ATP-binding protein [Nitrososphaerota archaeon]
MAENEGYFGKIALVRKSQQSNVIILETLDFKRYDELIQFARNQGFEKIENVAYEYYIYDIQLNQLFKINNVSFEPEIVEDFTIPSLISILEKRSSILIIKYVTEQRHADGISDLLLYCSQNGKLFVKFSTVFVFTASASLFSPSVRRFCATIEIPASTTEERRRILEDVANKLNEAMTKKYGAGVKINYEAVVPVSAGLNLHETETAALSSFFKYRDFKVEEFTTYKIEILKNYGLEYIIPTRGFESVGGYDYLKNYVKDRLIKLLKNPELAEAYGLRPPRGILFYGYPGTGKTYFAKALSKEIGLPMIKIDPSTFLRGIVGETESRVKQVINIVEALAPAIVFIDEFDQLAMSRSATMVTDSGVSRRLQNMLLDWLGDENRKSIIIGATNFVEQLDSAFIRTGRIDENLLILPPDTFARTQILSVHCNIVRKIPQNAKRPIDFAEIAERTYMFTGAELEKLVIEASALAFEEDKKYVSTEQFLEALKYIKVNVDEREKTIREMIRTFSKLENVNQKFLTEALKVYQESEKDDRIRKVVEGL